MTTEVTQFQRTRFIKKGQVVEGEGVRHDR